MRSLILVIDPQLFVICYLKSTVNLRLHAAVLFISHMNIKITVKEAMICQAMICLSYNYAAHIKKKLRSESHFFTYF